MITTLKPVRITVEGVDVVDAFVDFADSNDAFAARMRARRRAQRPVHWPMKCARSDCSNVPFPTTGYCSRYCAEVDVAARPVVFGEDYQSATRERRDDIVRRGAEIHARIAAGMDAAIGRMLYSGSFAPGEVFDGLDKLIGDE